MSRRLLSTNHESPGFSRGERQRFPSVRAAFPTIHEFRKKPASLYSSFFTESGVKPLPLGMGI